MLTIKENENNNWKIEKELKKNEDKNINNEKVNDDKEEVLEYFTE